MLQIPLFRRIIRGGLGNWSSGDQEYFYDLMIYFLLGEDRLAKDQKINEIKAACLSSDDALKFDYELLHSIKLDPAVLKKALIALPAVAKKRFILIRAVEKLSAPNKKIITDFI